MKLRARKIKEGRQRRETEEANSKLEDKQENSKLEEKQAKTKLEEKQENKQLEDKQAKSKIQQKNDKRSATNMVSRRSRHSEQIANRLDPKEKKFMEDETDEVTNGKRTKRDVGGSSSREVKCNL